MCKTQIIFAAAFLVVSALAFAHDDKGGPCSGYEATCKTDASVTGAADKKAKWKAMHECVKAAAAADTANGAACTAKMEKHHDHGKGGAPAAGGGAPAGGGAAPAAGK